MPTSPGIYNIIYHISNVYSNNRIGGNARALLGNTVAQAPSHGDPGSLPFSNSDPVCVNYTGQSVSSRSSPAGEMTRLEAMEVAEMELSEVAKLLQESPNITRAALEETRETEEIIEKLGSPALAIVQAGWLLSSLTPRLSSEMKRYLPEYRQQRSELHQRRLQQQLHLYEETSVSTLDASFTAIENDNPAAARLLSLLAFMNHEDIFIGLLCRDAADMVMGTSIQSVIKSKATVLPDRAWRSFLFSGQTWTLHDLEEAFETLRSFIVVQWRSDQQSYSVSKLVQARALDRLDHNQQRQLSFLSLELMADAIAQEGIDPIYRVRLLPHVMASLRAFLQLQKTEGMIAQNALVLMGRMGGFLFELGKFSEAYEAQISH